MPYPLPLAGPRVTPAGLPNAPVHGLYVHVPFCFHKCHYCDFYSITHQSAERMGEFVDALLIEARTWVTGDRPTPKPRTIFFGGGTPSLLPIEQMDRLLAGLASTYDLSNVAEWTVEVNPATTDLAYLQMLRSHGVDRLSFGGQSFNREELKTLERHHDPDDVPASIALARLAGFSRLNVDLIYAIPGQSLASWQRSLEQAVSLGLDHYSCYGLTYEPNTPLAVKRRLGQVLAAEESLEIEMFRLTRSLLRDAGIKGYEISNYARPGQESLHNLTYWLGHNYIGLGPSAASHLAGHRFKNLAHLSAWQADAANGRLALEEYESLSEAARIGERAMLLLRLSRGVSYDDFRDITDHDVRSVYADLIDRLASHNLIERNIRGFRIPESAIHLSDAIASEFLAVELPELSASQR